MPQVPRHTRRCPRVIDRSLRERRRLQLADKQPHLFTEFTQADDSITRKYGSTGLGLAIAARLCGLMGGALGFSSTEGCGSTFHFTIPLKKQGPEPGTRGEASDSTQTGILSRSAPAHTLPKGRRCRILVAEDNATNLTVALGLLEKLGQNADAVGNGTGSVCAAAKCPQGRKCAGG